MSYTDAAAAIRDLNATALANLCEGAMDNDDAAEFYTGVRDSFADAVEYTEGPITDDQRSEIADNAPSIWTHTKMMQLVGTRAYMDTPEIASGGEDIETLTGYVLYQLAARLVDQLSEFYAEYIRDEDDESDED